MTDNNTLLPFNPILFLNASRTPGLLKALIAFPLFLSAFKAETAIIWNWDFPDSTVLLQPTETFYMKGSISNDASSTSSISIGAYSWDLYNLSSNLTLSDFFNDPGADFTYYPDQNASGGIFTIGSIAPGRTKNFNIAHWTPKAPLPLGTTYTWWFEPFIFYNTPDEQTIRRTVTVTVIPEPACLTLMSTWFVLFVSVALQRCSVRRDRQT
ncbi:MAG TPA: hypothetical protein PLU30_22150 [Verrucomicrobiae bacterium]|nr:hypothetical protein [Verrucomicrobiae bacterium]